MKAENVSVAPEPRERVDDVDDTALAVSAPPGAVDPPREGWSWARQFRKK
jgi:hypothetical protein